MRTVEILDTTLRDGAQGEGISYSIHDKITILNVLSNMGVLYAEAGNPASSAAEAQFFREVSGMKFGHTQVAAFGSTRRKDTKAHEDKTLLSLIEANTDVVSIFGKTWDLHTTRVLGTTLNENLAMIRDSVAFIKSHGKTVIFDAEHFFDGFSENEDYALKCMEAAASGGADRLVLCDTRGNAFPDEVFEVVSRVSKLFSIKIGGHFHDDSGLAVANSLAAVSAGACHIHGTLLGNGERCGNANLSAIIPNLQLKRGIFCIPDEGIKRLTQTARYVAEVSNIAIPGNAPYIGRSAFAHKAGMHSDGVLKLPESFEHVDPECVGNERRLLLSAMAGRTALLSRLKKIAPELDRDSPDTIAIMDTIKEKEARGFQYEGAESSVEIIVRKQIGKYRPFFELEHFRLLGEHDETEDGHTAAVIIKIKVGDRVEITAAEGDGPVHALDMALRKALEVFYPSLGAVRLIDYKVRVLRPEDATAAKVRVLITSSDHKREWTTVGVSSDIIQASWLALVDSIEYKLLHDEENSLQNLVSHEE